MSVCRRKDYRRFLVKKDILVSSYGRTDFLVVLFIICNQHKLIKMGQALYIIFGDEQQQLIPFRKRIKVITIKKYLFFFAENKSTVPLDLIPSYSSIIVVRFSSISRT